MSYILDALKKSQRERALGTIPQIDALAPDPAARRGGRIAIAVVAAVVLIAGGIAAGMYLGRPASSPPRTAQSQTAAPELVPAAQPAAKEPEPVAAAAPPAAAPVAAQTTATQTAAPRPAQVPPLLSDTPLAYQRQVPSMSINVVSYSEVSERRFVMIDLVMYREGQTLPNGATVVAIAPDEVTFSFAGARFRLRP